MNYRFQSSESILIKGKRGRDRKRKVRKRRKNEFKKENLYYSLSMNYIASYPVFLHNLRLREEKTNSTNSTLLLQLQIFVKLQTHYLTNSIVRLDSS